MKKQMVISFVVIAIVISFVFILWGSPKPEEVYSSTGRIMGEGMKAYVDVSVKEAKDLIENQNNLIILDVSSSYDKGHIPGAINYYVGDGSLDVNIPSLNPEFDYLVYCHFDSASILGAQKLVDAGFSNVYRLEGNYAAWVEAGYEIEY